MLLYSDIFVDTHIPSHNITLLVAPPGPPEASTTEGEVSGNPGEFEELGKKIKGLFQC